MRSIARIFIMVPLALAPLAACKSRRNDKEAASSAKTPEAPTAREDFAEARDRAVQQMQTKLADLDTKLASLKRDAAARSAELTSEGKAAVTDAIAKLEQQRASAQDVLDEARASTAERWQQVKQRTNEALKSVDDAYDAAVKKLQQ